MKFAFSTLVAPLSDFRLLAGRANELGYDGLEVGVLPDNPAEAGAILESAGVEVACLAAPISEPSQRRKRQAAIEQLRQWLDVARMLGCGRLKIPGFLAPRGQTGHSAAAGLARWLLPLADDAAKRGVTIVIENDLSYRSAREVWTLLESINHPNVAACWDLFNASQAGESPFVSVPCLNSRIQYARVKDVQPANGGNQYCRLGDGSFPVESFLTRLMGIGYSGYVTVEAPDGLLPDAIEKLRTWSKPPKTTPGKKAAVVH